MSGAARVLVVSNAWPSAQKPYAGVFVERQVKWLREALGEGTVEVCAMPRTFTGLFGSLAKYLKAALRLVVRWPRRFDVVHVHFLSPLLFFCVPPRLLGRWRRLVLTVHGSDVAAYSRWGVRGATALAMRPVDGVLAVGEQLARDVRALYGPRSVRVLSAGVDDALFRPLPDAQRRYDLAFVGSLYTVKGFDRFCSALLRVPPGLRVLVVGSGPLQAHLDVLAGRHEVTVFDALAPDELAAEMARSRWLCAPSREEGFGLVVAEAGCCRIPAIVSPVGGLAQQVVDGRNGIVVDPDDAGEALAAAIAGAVAMEHAEWVAFADAAREAALIHAGPATLEGLLEVYGEGERCA